MNVPPFDLLQRRQWLCWRFEEKAGQSKPAKMPYYAGGGRRHGTQGSAEDRQSLVSYEEALPEIVTIYRGAYRANAIGLSWSLDRDVAMRFPTLTRYIGEGRPILTTATVRRDWIAFVKLDREEMEVVCSPEDVEVERVEYLKLRKSA